MWILDRVHLRGQMIYEMIWGGVSLCPRSYTYMLTTCKTITSPSSGPSVAQYEELTNTSGFAFYSTLPMLTVSVLQVL